MRGLSRFLTFLWLAFAEGKIFTVTGLRKWVDYTTKEPMGWLVDTVVTQDSTDYKCKDGEAISNLHEKVSFKVRSASKPSVNVGDSVLPVNPECSVYGEYRNQLSVRCDDVTIVPATGKDKV